MNKTTVYMALGRYPALKLWAIVFSLLYLIFAWEQIPTFLVSAYYCELKGGLKVHKTAESWRLENLIFLKDLEQKKNSKEQPVGEFSRGVYLNKWVLWERDIEVFPYLPVTIVKNELSDTRSGESLVSQVSVAAGYDKKPDYTGIKEYKFWVGGPSCDGGRYSFFKIVDEYSKIGVGK